MSEDTPATAGTVPTEAAPVDAAVDAVVEKKPARKRKEKAEVPALTPEEEKPDVVDVSELGKFKAFLQLNLSKVCLGNGLSEVTEEMAYNLFCEAFDSIVQYTAQSDKKRVSLVGVGRFYIKMSPPRKIATKPTSKYAAIGEIPHFRWKPSLKHFKWLIQEICHVDVEKLIESGVVEKPEAD